ncbi:MAG: chromosomal replication initiator protein DnaA [Bacteroidales bacterium]|nr:chromosomal replication initiator protein DnaA [Bacteroidales bacterium]
MENNHKTVWEQCLEVIKDNLGEQNKDAYKTWFLPIVPVQLEGSILTIQVPSYFFYDWLEVHYIDLIHRTIKLILGPEGQLKYSIVMDQSIAEKPIFTQLPSSPSHNATANRPKDIAMALNLSADGSKDLPNPFLFPGMQEIKIDSQLSESYTLTNFVEGNCNRLARAAGQAIAENPGKTAFNPLLIHGGVGLGKTHLANAIGLRCKELHPNLQVLYVTSEQFLQQYQNAGRDGTTNDFIYFYEMIDVLIIDDIQFWANKAPRTQEAFFHIFNYLHQRGKQIIITSDKAPSELSGLEPRLLSRLKWGLSADLVAPDVETRIGILKQKLANDGIDMPYDVIEYIAYNINSNVRELEGALISLVAQSSLNRRQITIDLAKQMIDKFVKSTTREITIDYIQKVVCDYFGLPIDSIQTQTRKREIVQARQLTMYFAKKMTKSSLAIIGLQCGNKDHATVLHACKQIANLVESDKQFKYWVDDIEKRFRDE